MVILVIIALYLTLFQLSDIDNHFKNKGKSTPVHIRPSPKLKMTPDKECNTPEPKLTHLKSNKEVSCEIVFNSCSCQNTII